MRKRDRRVATLALPRLVSSPMDHLCFSDYFISVATKISLQHPVRRLVRIPNFMCLQWPNILANHSFPHRYLNKLINYSAILDATIFWNILYIGLLLEKSLSFSYLSIETVHPLEPQNVYRYVYLGSFLKNSSRIRCELVSRYVTPVEKIVISTIS